MQSVFDENASKIFFPAKTDIFEIFGPKWLNIGAPMYSVKDKFQKKEGAVPYGEAMGFMLYANQFTLLRHILGTLDPARSWVHAERRFLYIWPPSYNPMQRTGPGAILA